MLAHKLRRGAGAAGRGPAALIDRTTGTNIGNGINFGGLAVAFDGITSTGDTSCAGKTAVAANSMYVGKTTAGPTAIESATVFGSNNSGYVHSTNPSVTITLYGKQGAAPSNGLDGTSLGSITFTDTNNESTGRLITSSDTGTYWDHVWINITQPNNNILCLAELQMTGWIT